MVGYTLSPLISRKVRSGLSAGRVQSVAVRLVVDREREIRAFTAVEYWTIEALLVAPGGGDFSAELVRIDGQKPVDRRRRDGRARTSRRSGPSRPVVESIAVKRSKRSPAPPFTTSTLQQEASRKLGFSPKRTMSVAQRLYEGVETPDGQVGLITYMRTDSVALAGPGDGRGARGHRRALRRRLHDAQGPAVQDEVEERPGGPRGDPADVVPARPGGARADASAATRPACTGSSGSGRSPAR